jgi:hypothetical protein
MGELLSLLAGPTLPQKHKAPGTSLFFSVTEEEHFFVADYFTEDGMFMETIAIPKQPSMTLEGFTRYCEFVAYFNIEEKGPF